MHNCQNCTTAKLCVFFVLTFRSKLDTKRAKRAESDKEKKSAYLALNTCSKFIRPDYDISCNRKQLTACNSADCEQRLKKQATKCCYTVFHNCFLFYLNEKGTSAKLLVLYYTFSAVCYTFSFTAVYVRVTVNWFYLRRCSRLFSNGSNATCSFWSNLVLGTSHCNYWAHLLNPTYPRFRAYIREPKITLVF